jgi:hypothetical protein
LREYVPHLHRKPWCGVNVRSSWRSDRIKGRSFYLSQTIRITLRVLSSATGVSNGFCNRGRSTSSLGRQRGLRHTNWKCRVLRCGVSRRVRIWQRIGLGANVGCGPELCKQPRMYPCTAFPGAGQLIAGITDM